MTSTFECSKKWGDYQTASLMTYNDQVAEHYAVLMTQAGARAGSHFVNEI